MKASNVQNDSERLESMFHEALAKTSLQERIAYLDDVCRGSAHLREELESLLSAHERAEDFLVLPNPGSSPSSAQSTSIPDGNGGMPRSNTRPIDPTIFIR